MVTHFSSFFADFHCRGLMLLDQTRPGLENFPEKRFFSARLASFPKAVGFGPSNASSSKREE